MTYPSCRGLRKGFCRRPGSIVHRNRVADAPGSSSPRCGLETPPPTPPVAGDIPTQYFECR